MADILLLEDDDDYAQAVRHRFDASTDAYLLTLHRARDIGAALAICRDKDVRVAIIDLSLPDGALGTDAISTIYQFDKKIIFIIHTVHGPQAIAEWCARAGVPYTSQFFLQKTGSSTVGAAADAAVLYDLAVKALRSYVPHLPPALASVRDVMEVIDTFSEEHPSFRRTAIVSNIHRSQDVLNSVSQWAADRLARTGYDSTRIGVALTGSFARLEGGNASDADYFVVFDDVGLDPGRLSDAVVLAYHAFLETGLWFERNHIPVHDYRAELKQPDKIEWHTSTLPTWFPLSSLLSAKLGRSTQLELTKQWFLLESFPLFNAPLIEDARRKILQQMGVLSRATVRDAIARSTLPESSQLLRDEFDYAFRHRRRESLTIVKHYFMRLLNLFSIRLWLVRCFLDPAVFEAPPDRLFLELSPHPAARVMQFHGFLRAGAVLQGRPLRQCLSGLEVICNLYAEAAQAFGSAAIRSRSEGSEDSTLANDLADAGQRCEECMLTVLRTLAAAPSITAHPELTLRHLL